MIKTITNNNYIYISKKVAKADDYILIFKDDTNYYITKVYSCANGDQRANIKNLKIGDNVKIKKINKNDIKRLINNES